VRKGYHQMVQAEPNRWSVVDAGQKWDDVQTALRKAILDRLKK
jgi:thymidylate kinase